MDPPFGSLARPYKYKPIWIFGLSLKKIDFSSFTVSDWHRISVRTRKLVIITRSMRLIAKKLGKFPTHDNGSR
jgi:hypothetical protein